MGLFSKLFGSTPKPEEKVEPVEYKGFYIYAEAQPESGQYRVAGRITKTVDDETKEHRFIRSDVVQSKEDANSLMLHKSKLFIDQMNGNIFD